MTKVAKLSLAAVAVAFAFSFAVIASASSASAIYTPASGYLMVGSGMGAKAYQAPNVVAAQSALNACVPGTALVLDGKYGPLTKGKFVAFQASVGVAQDGIIGPITAAQLADCSDDQPTTPPTTTPPTGLQGGAGSISDTTLISGISNEEVGEEEEDIKVYGIEVEADDNSDINITSMKLVFDEGTAGSDFEDYVSEVSIWYGSEEIARVDGDVFTDDNNWTKTVSFDEDAVIEADEKGKFYVAVSGVNNLDSADAGDTWTLDITNARFEDGDGAITTDTVTEAARTFSFESFSTASDIELKVTEGDEDVNDGHVINVDATDDTDGESLLSFNIEIEGTSDVVIDSLPVTVTSAETTGDDPADLISTYYLYADGEEIGSENAVDAGSNSVEVVVFDDLDYSMNSGDEVEFTVKADFGSIADALDAGDTIQVTFGETETDLATFDVEDEAGEDLSDADKTGSVTGDTHELRDIGMMVTFVSSDTSAVKSHTGDVANTLDHDEGTFTIAFEVEAFDGDIYVDLTAPTETGGATESDVNVTGTDTYVTSSITSSTGATEGTDGFLVEEGQSEQFEITYVTAAGADGLFQVKLGSILYALTDIDGNLVYNFNLDDFKTSLLSLNFDA